MCFWGLVYIRFQRKWCVRKLTRQLRALLHKPLGIVLDLEGVLARLRRARGAVISVGDECSCALIASGAKPDVVVYDHRCMRARIDEGMRKVLDGYDGKAAVVANPAGTISDELFEAVGSAVAKAEGKILVDGEEDLAALVAIMLSKNGAVVLYGQPRAGIVLVRVNEKSRKVARAIYERMVPSA